MTNSKKFDLFILIVLLILAPFVTLYFKTSLLFSTLLFYGLPAAYLTYRSKTISKKIVTFSLIGTVIFYVLDYVAVHNKTWWVSTVFNFRLPGSVPLEDSIWFFLGVYLIVMFYEYFDDSESYRSRNKRSKYYVVLMLFILAFLLFGAFIYPPLLTIPYYYLVITIIFFIVPTALLFWFYPQLRFKFLRTNLYVFALHLPFEIVALKINQWNFPAQDFIGTVKLFGSAFPFEEFLAFISMTGIALLCFYEFFEDDMR
jgi:hypothetical protein